MKNIFAKTYKIKCNDIIYLNFQFTCFIADAIADQVSSTALREQMLRNFDFKSFRLLSKQMDDKDDDSEETDELIELVLTEMEICSYLCLAIFVSKIADSKYFVFMKNLVPSWEGMLSDSFSRENKPGQTKSIMTIEEFTEFFTNDLMILVRLAKMRFRDKPSFVSRIDSAFNYQFS